MKQPHKHAELIKAWADGAEIQYRDSLGRWFDFEDDHRWSDNVNYRIKPEPKPDVIEYRYVLMGEAIAHRLEPNLKLTFDGETAKLKSAEVI